MVAKLARAVMKPQIAFRWRIVPYHPNGGTARAIRTVVAEHCGGGLVRLPRDGPWGALPGIGGVGITAE
jgi:hypothetical protein